MSGESARGGSFLRALGVGCGVLVFLVLSLLGLSARLILAQADAAASACAGFLRDVRAEDHASALRRMSPSYQRDFDPAHLRDAVSRLSPLAEHASALLSSVESHDDARASVEGTLFGRSGATPVACELTERDGYWYIDVVVVEGAPLD